MSTTLKRFINLIIPNYLIIDPFDRIVANINNFSVSIMKVHGINATSKNSRTHWICPYLHYTNFKRSDPVLFVISTALWQFNAKTHTFHLATGL